MSGKYCTNQNRGESKNLARNKIITLVLCAIALCAALIFVFIKRSDKTQNTRQDPVQMESAGLQEGEGIENQAQMEEIQDISFELDHNLRIEKVGAYTGLYMENGSDEVVSGVAMIVVTNLGEEYIQYAEITLTSDAAEAFFTLSSLFPGESMIVLDQNRVRYADLSGNIAAEAKNVAVFQEAPNLCEDQLELQALDGALNVTNISGEDIVEDIVIYYKNSVEDMLYGGITYRIRITGGMKAGEIKQIMSEHFSASGSRIMFITCS